MNRTVRELLRTLDAAELVEWQVYNELDPFTEDRADWRMGQLAAVVANCHSTKRTFKPSDFIPQFGPPRTEARDEADLLALAMRCNAMLGGAVQ